MKLIATFLLSLVMIATATHSYSKEPLLHYLVRQPSVKTDKPPLLILLHGVGGNEKDLFSFADQLPGKYLVISARGPYTLGKDSYGWYELGFANGKPLINKEQAEKSRTTIIQFISQLKGQYSFDESQVYLLGFSQGAIMSYSVGLTESDKIKGIAIMSGRLLDEVKPIIAPAAALKNLKIFISHGTADNTLNIQYARDSKAFLEHMGIHPVYKEYNAGHTISADMLHDMISWLQ